MPTGEILAISTMKQLHGICENGSDRSQEKTLDVLCYAIVFTLVLHGVLAMHSSIPANTHNETERLTLTDNRYSELREDSDHCSQTILYCRCQEFLIKSSVDTLFHKVDYM